jgi:hypothetical protein
VILFVALAHAVQVRAHDGPCPVGTGNVRVFERISDNTSGGYDSDLATYSSDGQWRTFRLATCADNLFSLYGDDLLALTADQRKQLEGALPAAVAGVKDSKNPELWERYAIAASLYHALGKDDRFLGNLWLEASWTARDTAIGFYAGLQGPKGARALIDAGWEELKKPLSVEDRKKVLYNLARIAHRGGWGDERDGFLAAFEAAGPVTDREKESLDRFRRFAQVVEPALQDHAIEAFTAALRSQAPGDEKTRMTYLLADLLRRRGRLRDAAPLYFLVANDRDTPDELRELAVFLVTPIAEKLEKGG